MNRTFEFVATSDLFVQIVILTLFFQDIKMLFWKQRPQILFTKA